MESLITLHKVRQNPEIRNFLEISERQMDIMGYTEHSYRHCGLVAKNAGNILTDLGYEERKSELARIAGYLHDIGNSINRMDHAHTGAILAYNILIKMGMGYVEAGEIMLAIGNHDEKSGTAVSEISSALILADKSDVHRSRVRNKKIMDFDIHDRVNFAVVRSRITVDPKIKTAVLALSIDTAICPVMDYFEIFLDRMTMNKKAADFLDLKFQLIVNESRLL